MLAECGRPDDVAEQRGDGLARRAGGAGVASEVPHAWQKRARSVLLSPHDGHSRMPIVSLRRNAINLPGARALPGPSRPLDRPASCARPLSPPATRVGYRSSVATWDLTPKPVPASQVTLVQLMELADANIAGIVHGGVVMKLVDTAAGLAAIKHCGGLAVTVGMDEIRSSCPSTSATRSR